MKISEFGKIFGVNGSFDDMIRDTIAKRMSEDAFYACDLYDIWRKHNNWLLKLPRVRPFYAVKCNSTPVVLELLSGLGIGFDCASKTEIDAVLGMGVSPDRIIYANPCKAKAYIAHARASGIDHMTFDNEMELYKVHQLHPNAKMVLRIRVDDTKSIIRLGLKFGAQLNRVERLLQVAKKLAIDVIGCSFHVGSGCESTDAFRNAIADAKYVFDLAQKIGFNMTLLDIGGGFPGASDAVISFEDTAQVINNSLDKYFPQFDQNGNRSKVEIIAEPGRYYVASAYTVAANIIAKRLAPPEHTEDETQSVDWIYLSDGIFGSLNIALYEHWQAKPILFGPGRVEEVDSLSDRPTRLATLWGPTCDSMDCVAKDVLMPVVNVGDWVVFRDMGAYTIAASTTFNGFQISPVKYYLPPHTIDLLKSLPNCLRICRLIEHSEFEHFSDIPTIDFADSTCSTSLHTLSLAQSLPIMDQLQYVC